jgi:hypothetical protein
MKVLMILGITLGGHLGSVARRPITSSLEIQKYHPSSLGFGPQAI